MAGILSRSTSPLQPVRAVSAALTFALACTVLPAAPALAADEPLILAQGQSQDRDQDRDKDRDQDKDQDRDRDWSDADRDRIRDRLRDGSCQDVVAATDEMLAVIRSCLTQDRARDGSCQDRIDLGLEALQSMRDRCRGN